MDYLRRNDFSLKIKLNINFFLIYKKSNNIDEKDVIFKD